MATVDGLTKARMLAIEAESITDARLDVVTHHLILVKHDLSEIDVGSVIGPIGPTGGPAAGSTAAGPAAFGDAPTPGVGVAYSRYDHDHGLPSLPTNFASFASVSPSINTLVSLVSGTTVAAQFDTVNTDTDAYYSAAQKTRLTVPASKGGKFKVGADLTIFPGNGVATGLNITLRKNGATQLAQSRYYAAANQDHTFRIAWEGPLVVGDYVEVLVFHGSTAAGNVESVAQYGAGTSPFFIERLGA